MIRILSFTILFIYLFFQGTFSVYEKFRQVEEFVTENLEHALPFVLVDSASGQRLDEDSTKDSALIDLGLIPGKVEKNKSGF